MDAQAVDVCMLALNRLAETNQAASAASGQLPAHSPAAASPVLPQAGWGTLRADPNAPRPEISEDDFRSLAAL